MDHTVKAKDYNFDHPNALDFDLAYETILKLLDRKEATVPVYSFVEHKRVSEIVVKPADIILFEGILALFDEVYRNNSEN